MHAHKKEEYWWWRDCFLSFYIRTPFQKYIIGFKNGLIFLVTWVPIIAAFLEYPSSLCTFMGQLFLMYMKRVIGTLAIIRFCYFVHQCRAHNCVSREVFWSTRSQRHYQFHFNLPFQLTTWTDNSNCPLVDTFEH